MTLSRAHLESGYFQKLAEHNARDGRPAPLTDPGEAWIFGYGSLIWNPLFEFDRQQIVTLHGYRRRFCLKTELSRGTRECPGLVLGLEPGGSCRGIAYRLSGPSMIDELRLLWRREMVTGAYQPRWVRLRFAEGALAGLAFVMNRHYPHYAGGLSDEETAHILAQACGPLGTCAEYLLRTHEGLLAHGIADHHMQVLVDRVRAIGCTE
jgi:cation transport protein ChaC